MSIKINCIYCGCQIEDSNSTEEEDVCSDCMASIYPDDIPDKSLDFRKPPTSFRDLKPDPLVDEGEDTELFDRDEV